MIALRVGKESPSFLKTVQDSNKPWQLNAILVEVGPDGLAKSIEQVQRVVA